MANRQVGTQAIGSAPRKRGAWLMVSAIAAVAAGISLAVIVNVSEDDACSGVFEEDACRFEERFGPECEKTDNYEKCIDGAGFVDHLRPETQQWVRAMQSGPLRGSRWGAYLISVYLDPPGIYCGEQADEPADTAAFQSLVTQDRITPFNARWWIAEVRQRVCPQDLTVADQSRLADVERLRSARSAQERRPQSDAPSTTPTVIVPSLPPSKPLPPPSMSGVDSQGFIAGPQCMRTDSGVLFLRTEQSRVVICRSAGDMLYYRGIRLSDGAGLDLAEVQPNGGGYTAINATDGTEYRVSPQGLVIVSEGREIASEIALESAVM